MDLFLFFSFFAFLFSLACFFLLLLSSSFCPLFQLFPGSLQIHCLALGSPRCNVLSTTFTSTSTTSKSFISNNPLFSPFQSRRQALLPPTSHAPHMFSNPGSSFLIHFKTHIPTRSSAMETRLLWEALEHTPLEAFPTLGKTEAHNRKGRLAPPSMVALLYVCFLSAF